MSTQEIRDIYKKVVIGREQEKGKLKKEVEVTLEKRMTTVFGKYFKMLQDPKVSVADQDTLKRDMGKMIDIIHMDTDHDVIMALTDNLLMDKAKKKMLENMKK